MTTSPAPSSEALRAAAERDAERLADTLFAKLVTQATSTDAVSPLSLEPASRASDVSGLVLSDRHLIPVPPPVGEPPTRTKSGSPAWERWAFLGAAGFLLATLVWNWRTQPPAPSPPASASHQELIEHLQATLAEIERDERHARQLAAARAERERRELAEREAAEAAAAASVPVPPPPPVALPQIVVQGPPPPVASVVPVAPPPPPVAPAEPKPVTAVAPVAAAPPSAPTPAAKPAPEPVLEVVGSIEIDDRAIALIGIDGKVERYSAGASLPGTRWSIASIAPRQVVLRDRAGRERTVAVGNQL